MTASSIMRGAVPSGHAVKEPGYFAFIREPPSRRERKTSFTCLLCCQRKAMKIVTSSSRKRFLIIGIALTVCTGTTTIQADKPADRKQVRYRVTDLGTLPTCDNTYATAVNDSGWVVASARRWNRHVVRSTPRDVRPMQYRDAGDRAHRHQRAHGRPAARRGRRELR